MAKLPVVSVSGGLRVPGGKERDGRSVSRAAAVGSPAPRGRELAPGRQERGRTRARGPMLVGQRCHPASPQGKAGLRSPKLLAKHFFFLKRKWTFSPSNKRVHKAPPSSASGPRPLSPSQGGLPTAAWFRAGLVTDAAEVTARCGEQKEGKILIKEKMQQP